ncbi:hypothetical protein EZS27_033198 [termite gut metagenome]|uniref:Uncharacterized protein n=1 Tax=termite gut metagenome TaxID=433724 RepID=A0A5J4Q6T9_9ZZZZ
MGQKEIEKAWAEKVRKDRARGITLPLTAGAYNDTRNPCNGRKPQPESM